MRVPIRVSRDRVVLYGSALFFFGLWQLVRNTLHDLSHADWSCFWVGGATVGTKMLLDPTLHYPFAHALGLRAAIWPYLPAFAWLYAPAAHFPVLAGYIVNAAAMFAIAACAGMILADVFEMPRWFGVVAVLAWAPVKVAALGGQNTALALLLTALALLFAKRESPVLLGSAIGALLYKPTIALPFIALLLARREWRTLLAVTSVAAVWYLLSVPAAGGNWLWPQPYVAAIHAYFNPDFKANAANAVSLPELLMRFGVPSVVALWVAAAIFIAALLRLARVGLVAALSVTSALAVALSPHAWQYEPVILLPPLFYAMRTLTDPLKTWLVIASYVIAAVSIFEIPGLSWDVLVIVVLAWSALLLRLTASHDESGQTPSLALPAMPDAMNL
jgi:hypothetical protein